MRHALLHIDSALAAQGGKAGTNDGARKKLLKQALKWSVAKGPRAFGDKEINAAYGELLWGTGEVRALLGVHLMVGEMRGEVFWGVFGLVVRKRKVARTVAGRD